MLSDIEIAQRAKKVPIEKIAIKLRIPPNFLTLYGRFIAKISPDILEKAKNRKPGKYILVTAITPTPLGEGKTVTTIGLSMALNRLGRLTCASIRQPSLGPVFGIKGGAAGGGYAQVLPMEDFNLHFTGDVHAVGLAHNLAAAFLDNSLFRGNPLGIDPQKIYWRRVIDINDRSLRSVGFDITASSEIMAILALSTSLKDLRRRIGRIVLADSASGKPLTAEDLKVAGSMTVLLKEALKPNLIQTLEHTPVFAHAGPFGNIAHGNSSILADKIALAFSDYVVTEAGFGADSGAEKFFDIKCRTGGFFPSCAVIVCSIRALKMHGGAGMIEEGICNLEKQIENIKAFGIPAVVAINRFACDTDKEIEFVKQKAVAAGAYDCSVSNVWAQGSRGGLELAKSVIRAAQEKNDFKFLYPAELPIKEKVKIIATRMYGARDVEYEPRAEEKIDIYTKRGWGILPICMAKTHLSLSCDPDLKGRPRDFILPVRDIRACLGAGFLYPLCGKIQTLPGLPAHPAGEKIDIDDKGNIVGLF
ncbi:MAG: formate--tetrahydrofolate ligase [Candidatus Omnitrophica bacterium]|nr:formate--tetrahydrofolate ligase [Candidatus Omnitrophota bacterium]